MKDVPFAAPIRDKHPCKTCPDIHKRPECRKECEKDAAWHRELERVKSNQREYERMLGIRRKGK